LINGPMEVPGGDWIAQFIDPQGAAFAVHALKADLAPAEAAAAAPAPQQGTLDFPPADSSGPETVSVAAQKPAAKRSVKQGVTPRQSTEPAEKQPAKKVAPARKTPIQKKTAKKAAPAEKSKARKSTKKSAKKPASKTKRVAPKAGKKSGRKTPAKQAKKSTRPVAKKKATKARRAK
jgi:hypothetical protein